jgi:hypothetical protein
LFPFNPDRVLRVTPKPPAQSTVPRADEIRVGSCHQDEVPQTPVTPVSAEGLASLHNLIRQDAHTLNETSIPRLERRVKVSIAECALLRDDKQMLTRMNNEAKFRRSTKALKLGDAKVMSFEDIVVARAARAAKDVIKDKGKRGRKRKSVAIEPEEPNADELEADSEPEVARVAKEAIKGQGKPGRKRKIAAQEAEEPEPEVARVINVPWRAPVAQMM